MIVPKRNAKSRFGEGAERDTRILTLSIGFRSRDDAIYHSLTFRPKSGLSTNSLQHLHSANVKRTIIIQLVRIPDSDYCLFMTVCKLLGNASAANERKQPSHDASRLVDCRALATETEPVHKLSTEPSYIFTSHATRQIECNNYFNLFGMNHHPFV